MLSTVWTIGHSSRPFEAFLNRLAHYRLETLSMAG